MPNETLIWLEGVSVTYPGGISALRSVSAQVRRGELTVLLGRSGAGKSTLLRCLNRLQAPDEGCVRVADLGNLSRSEALRKHRRQTGMIFQAHHLIGRQTALQNVLMGRLGYYSTFRSLFPLPNSDVRMAMDCLERVGLADHALHRTDCLSGGERQRVGIARALVQRPRLLLADEPVASLDPATAEAVMELMTRICREDGLTAVFSLHQLEFARHYGDRILGLSQGRIVFDGAPAELTDVPLRHLYQASVTGPAGASPAVGKRTITSESRRTNHDQTVLSS